MENGLIVMGNLPKKNDGLIVIVARVRRKHIPSDFCII